MIVWKATLFASGQTMEKDTCSRMIGKSEYLLADYSNIGWSKEMRDTLYVLQNHFKQCFCDNQDKVFLKGLEKEQKAEVVIEPLIINLKSCDGLYAYRSFLKGPHLDPYFFNGIMHHVFLVSKGKVYYLNKRYAQDTLAVNKILDLEKPHLMTMLSERDIQIIDSLGSRSTYWTDNSIEVPLIIYSDKNAIHFDNRRK